MKNESPQRLEIFLLLAARHVARANPSNVAADGGETVEAETTATAAAADKFFSVFAGQLPAPQDAAKFERLSLEYRNKPEDEKRVWRERIENFIGKDEPSLDENIHRSHIDAALREESASIRKIIADSLPRFYRNQFAENETKSDNVQESREKRRSIRLEQSVRLTFAGKFVALRDLPAASAFDRLNGAQLARLARLAGIREVALACARIEAVESVTAFLRRFAAEDARVIAAQLRDFTRVSDAERLSFAENLVQTALELEPQPSAMLDLLGIWLTGILLCAGGGAPDKRIAYTAQKLPLEIAPKLLEIIEARRRETPAALQNKIAAEIERLAETIVSAPTEAKTL